METVYLFSVQPSTPPIREIDSGEEVSVVVRGAFADVPDIREVPTPFTPAADGHPLAPIAGPILVRGAEPGDAVTIDLLEISPQEDGSTAILRDFGVLREEFGEPRLMACPVRDGKAWFADRIPTAEHIAMFCWEQLTSRLPAGTLANIRLWETPRNYVDYHDGI